MYLYLNINRNIRSRLHQQIYVVIVTVKNRQVLRRKVLWLESYNSNRQSHGLMCPQIHSLSL